MGRGVTSETLAVIAMSKQEDELGQISESWRVRIESNRPCRRRDGSALNHGAKESGSRSPLQNCWE
jgi:hypothetical protein